VKARRVSLRTSRQLRTLDAKGHRKRRAETRTGTVTKYFPRSSLALVRFDGRRSVGSVAGLTLIVDLKDTESAS
jgi:hypothetical protein